MDNDWRAAQAARDPQVDGITGTGLPRRPPQKNLVPGAAMEDLALLLSDSDLAFVSREPDDVRERLDNLIGGQERARAGESTSAGRRPVLPPNPMTAPSPLPIASLEPMPPMLNGWDEPLSDGWRTFRPGL